MMEKIKAPCPFCGARPEEKNELGEPMMVVVPHHSIEGRVMAYTVMCQHCAAEGPAGDTIAEAVALWNKERGHPSGGGKTMEITLDVAPESYTALRDRMMQEAFATTSGDVEEWTHTVAQALFDLADMAEVDKLEEVQKLLDEALDALRNIEVYLLAALDRVNPQGGK